MGFPYIAKGLVDTQTLDLLHYGSSVSYSSVLTICVKWVCSISILNKKNKLIKGYQKSTVNAIIKRVLQNNGNIDQTNLVKVT